MHTDDVVIFIILMHELKKFNMFCMTFAYMLHSEVVFNELKDQRWRNIPRSYSNDKRVKMLLGCSIDKCLILCFIWSTMVFECENLGHTLCLAGRKYAIRSDGLS